MEQFKLTGFQKASTTSCKHFLGLLHSGFREDRYHELLDKVLPICVTALQSLFLLAVLALATRSFWAVSTSHAPTH